MPIYRTMPQFFCNYKEFLPCFDSCPIFIMKKYKTWIVIAPRVIIEV